MAKFNSTDILRILRKFEIAGEDNVPRNIEELKKITPDEFSEIFSFKFLNAKYFIIVDGTAEDDENYILGLLKTIFGDIEGELQKNPSDDLLSFAIPYQGKDVYLFKNIPNKRRLDLVLSEQNPEISRSTIQKHIKLGNVKVNKKQIFQTKFLVNKHDEIQLNTPKIEIGEKEFPIIFEDENVIVVDKPAGILTHSKGIISEEFTVADFFKLKGSTFGSSTNRCGIVHRLDRDTSGVIIGAKNDMAAKKLQKQFSERTVKKTYYAIIDGHLEQKRAIIDLPIVRNPNSPSTFKVDAKGKSAQTKYEVIEETADFSEVKLMPKTGRTHQLRVHLAYLNTPILGDKVYSKTAGKFDRMFLHAAELEISIPPNLTSETSIRKIFRSNLPNGFKEIMQDD